MPRVTKKQQTEQEIKEQKAREFTNFAKNSFYYNSGSSISSTNANIPRAITQGQLKSYMQNPIMNYQQLINTSLYLYSLNGNYFRIVEYWTNINMLFHYIYPYINPSLKMDKLEKLEESRNNSAMLLDMFNIKTNTRNILRKTILQGISFWYKIQDSKNIILKEMPYNICRLKTCDNGVYRYEIDVSKIKNEELETYPKEIQSFKEEYNNQKENKNSLNNNENKVTQWFEVSDKGMCFPFNDVNLPFTPPPLSFLFEDVFSLDIAKDSQLSTDVANNMKLIWQQIPMDEEGNITIDSADVTMFHEAIKKNLPKGIGIASTPMKLEPITLQSTVNSQATSIVDRAKQNFYDTVGVSSILFGDSSKASEGILKIGKKIDEGVVTTLLETIATYFNYELKKELNSIYPWKMTFLNSTQDNWQDLVSLSYQEVAIGGSKTKHLALQGYTPLESLNILMVEKMLDVNQYFVPLLNSNQMSSNDVNNNGGRPKSETPTDSGEVSREQI